MYFKSVHSFLCDGAATSFYVQKIVHECVLQVIYDVPLSSDQAGRERWYNMTIDRFTNRILGQHSRQGFKPSLAVIHVCIGYCQPDKVMVSDSNPSISSF